jgi:hypothetical protein
MPLGNAFEDKLTRIWRGEEVLKLRKDMLLGNLSKYPTCLSCKKWLDYMPAYPVSDMGQFSFSSNGLYLSYATNSIRQGTSSFMLKELEVWDRSFVPFQGSSKNRIKLG